MHNNRVVITGMGIYSCIGRNLQEVKKSLYEGKSGIGIDPRRKELGYRSSLTGILEKPNLKGILDRRNRICLPEHGAFAYIATQEALENAHITLDYLKENEAGIIYGNDSCAQAVIEGVDTIREKKDTRLVGSGNIFQSMNSTISMNLSVIYGLKGINFTVSSACASGSHSIGLAYMLIKNGFQNCVICGGAQEVNEYAVGSFDGLSAFSAREDSPQEASRPFDKNRDGLVPSGGAASLILEDYDTAKKRGANIIAEVISYGFSSNGEHISVPNVEGPMRSLKMAIDRACLEAKDIQYINAHATSTPVGDRNEALAISNVFAGAKPIITSTKSMTGHEMWMAGASEIVYSNLMMQNNFIAGNINFQEGDEASSSLNIPNKRVDMEFDTYLSNSFGFGGTNSTLIIKKI